MLIGFPLVVLAVGLGVRIIASEIDRRTLEIAYTVPGGTARVWVAKLAAAVLLVLAAEVVLAWTVQNRIGFALVCAALIALAFGRAENREKLLGG